MRLEGRGGYASIRRILTVAPQGWYTCSMNLFSKAFADAQTDIDNAILTKQVRKHPDAPWLFCKVVGRSALERMLELGWELRGPLDNRDIAFGGSIGLRSYTLKHRNPNMDRGELTPRAGGSDPRAEVKAGVQRSAALLDI